MGGVSFPPPLPYPHFIPPPCCCPACPDGYYCAPGSTSATTACGLGFFCRSPSRTAFTSGYYGLPEASPGFYSAQVPCTPGHYCLSNGTRVICPVGRYGVWRAWHDAWCMMHVPVAFLCGMRCRGGWSLSFGMHVGPTCGAGNAAGSASTICPNLCPPGFTCDAGATETTDCGAASSYCPGNGLAYGVPAGAYSTPVASLLSQRTGMAWCTPGSYCVSGLRYACSAGKYGSAANLSDPNCNGQCSAGHYCPANSTSSTAAPCGNVTVYCPTGSSLPSSVLAGYYSVGGGTVATQTAQVMCEPGSFCVGGLKYLCPAGTFSAATSLATTCTSTCPSGYFCPAGSTTGTSNPCGGADRYCPPGVGSPVSVDVGNYSTPTAASASLRTGSSMCEAGSYCVSGVKYFCPAGRFGLSRGSTSSVRPGGGGGGGGRRSRHTQFPGAPWAPCQVSWWGSMIRCWVCAGCSDHWLVVSSLSHLPSPID